MSAVCKNTRLIENDIMKLNFFDWETKKIMKGKEWRQNETGLKEISDNPKTGKYW